MIFDKTILAWILFFPTAASLVVMLFPKARLQWIRWVSFIASLVPFTLTVLTWLRFNPIVNPSTPFQFEINLAWYEAVNSTFHLGVDGISLTMVLLTTILTPLAILASFNIQERVKTYMVLFLLLETGMLGVFMALDLLLFFVFWEVGLVPMYFLIAMWGGKNRNYASLKFMLYTLGGSLGLLLATQFLGVTTRPLDMFPLFQTCCTIQ